MSDSSKTFLQWLTEDYLSQDTIMEAYAQELKQQKTKVVQNIIEQLKEDLSPCTNCASYHTCNRKGAQICQKRAVLNDKIAKAVKEAHKNLY